MRTRSLLLATAAVLAGTLLGGCSDDRSPMGPGPNPRTYYMGFSWFPPRPDLNLALVTINLWSIRADAALIAVSPPWDSLLAGRAPDSLVRNNELGGGGACPRSGGKKPH